MFTFTLKVHLHLRYVVWKGIPSYLKWHGQEHIAHADHFILFHQRVLLLSDVSHWATFLWKDGMFRVKNWESQVFNTHHHFHLMWSWLLTHICLEYKPLQLMCIFDAPYFYVIFITLLFGLRNSKPHFSPKCGKSIDRHAWTNSVGQILIFYKISESTSVIFTEDWRFIFWSV